jgi:hypothetical protein
VGGDISAELPDPPEQITSAERVVFVRDALKRLVYDSLKANIRVSGAEISYLERTQNGETWNRFIVAWRKLDEPYTIV